ncbi:MAG TPA: sulfur carrier protein ThiS [Actinophytocola sp.]|nr:sulfur carrier protein ThiS [Actinophytocola sp.]HEU5471727.1 sulfur carrier protein ThiS [Actinophytocola sp.]
MEVRVNGERRTLPDGTTVAGLLAELGMPVTGVAVALDGEVVPRTGHAGTPVPDGAVIEVVTAVQGG